MATFRLYLRQTKLGPPVPDLWLGSRVLDNGLDVLRTEANEIWVLSIHSTDYSAAVTAKLGTAPAAFGTITASGNNRRIASSAVTAGTVTSVGTASRWAVVDTVNSRLLATGDMSGDALTNLSYVWTLDPITILQSNT